MITNLPKYSMKYMGYVEWAEALVVVTVEYRPRSYRSRAKAQGQIRSCCGLVGHKGFKDSSVRVNGYHPILEHIF